MTALGSDDAYSRAYRCARFAAIDLDERLHQILRELGDPFLVRAEVRPWRIKSKQSLERKASLKKWTLEQAIQKAWDFLGIRIVCNNLEDEERAASLVRERLEKDGLKVTVRDYVTKPQSSGYRAVHLVCQYTAALGSHPVTFGCEIQIRTLLQEAWGQLSRADVYTRRLPRRLERRMRRLADTLARADSIAEQIRVEIIRPRRVTRQPSAGAPLSDRVIAYLYSRAFKEDPPEYVVESILRDYETALLRSDGLDKILHDDTFLAEMASAYTEHARWKPQRDQLFRWAVHAAVNGIAAGPALARRAGREAWEEIDHIYKSEISSSIPESWDELEQVLSHPSKDEDSDYDIQLWAEYFDSAAKCTCCGADLVEVEQLTWRLIEHFKLRRESAAQAFEKIYGLIANSGVDDSEGTEMCSHCRYVLNKDD